MRNITKSVLGLSLALALFGIAVGGAGAVTMTDWNGTENATESFDVSNDTDSLRVIGDTLTNGSATVYVYGVENGTETQVATTTITTDADSTGDGMTTWDYTTSEPPAYDTMKVVVVGDGAETLEIAKVGIMSGGGGILAGGTGPIPMVELAAGGVVLVVVGGAWVATRRD